jgi:uncharacterized protein (TIGR02145 family)
MNHVFTILAFALMSSVSAQTVLPPNYPYNPDSDGDEFVAVSDVLMSVASYDNEFQVQSIMVDTLSLEEAIQILLQQQIQNQQTLINQQALINGLSNALANVEGFDACAFQWACGCPLSYQGYDYETVQIGEQCWFAENLRSVQYQNGDEIPGDIGEVAWSELTEGAQAVFGQNEVNCIIEGGWSSPTDSSFQPCDETWSLATYGRLYNSYAVVDPRGVCPSGWHVSTDVDWGVLESFLVSQGHSGQEGLVLKSNTGWGAGLNGTDAYGFGALPGGQRTNEGSTYAGSMGRILSPSDFYISSYRDFIANGPMPTYVAAPYDGLSIRCIKDSE